MSSTLSTAGHGYTLRDRHDSVAAGALIAVTNASGTELGGCTVGFVVKNQRVAGARGDSLTFLTASHCSQVKFQYDGSKYYQPAVTPEDYVGDEVLDPTYFVCCTANLRTRWSDALLGDVRHATRQLVRGRVFRTTFAETNRANGLSGSIIIDQNRPYFEVVGIENSIYLNTFVGKMGEKTGWTTGNVNATCADRWTNTHKTLCNHMAKYWSDFGDSGGPVFMNAPSWPDGYIMMVGIHWGGFGNPPTAGSAVFSPMGNIQRSDELGYLRNP